MMAIETEPKMSEQIMVRLTPELLNQLRTVSLDSERTVAQTVRLAIRGYLGRAALEDDDAHD